MTREDFYPGFAKAKSYYEKEFPPGSKKHWPYDTPVAERAHKEWLKLVVDPSSEEFYKSTTGDLPQYTINQIVRVKRGDGSEFLYSIGQVKGYNMYGDPVVTDVREPEAYEQAIFLHETLRDERDGHNKRFTTGIAEKLKHYELEYSPENVDKLLAKRSSSGCMLTLKNETSGQVEECKSEDMFRNKSFDYIFSREWQSAEEKELALKHHEAMQGPSGQAASSSTTRKR
jgi:hypothetical protein